jgi:hypothetical protein
MLWSKLSKQNIGSGGGGRVVARRGGGGVDSRHGFERSRNSTNTAPKTNHTALPHSHPSHPSMPDSPYYSRLNSFIPPFRSFIPSLPFLSSPPFPSSISSLPSFVFLHFCHLSSFHPFSGCLLPPRFFLASVPSFRFFPFIFSFHFILLAADAIAKPLPLLLQSTTFYLIDMEKMLWPPLLCGWRTFWRESR